MGFTDGLLPIVNVIDCELKHVPLVVYVREYVPAFDDANVIAPEFALKIAPDGVIVKTPPFLPVMLAIGFGSKVLQNELLGYVKAGFSFGFTVSKKVSLIPIHEPEIGVTITLPVIEFPPTEVPTPVNGEIFPVPESVKPILVLSLVQLKIVPGEPTKLIALKVDPSQVC